MVSEVEETYNTGQCTNLKYKHATIIVELCIQQQDLFQDFVQETPHKIQGKPIAS